MEPLGRSEVHPERQTTVPRVGAAGIQVQQQTQNLCEAWYMDYLEVMGSYKWRYTSPNMGYMYSCPTYNPTSNYP